MLEGEFFLIKLNIHKKYEYLKFDPHIIQW